MAASRLIGSAESTRPKRLDSVPPASFSTWEQNQNGTHPNENIQTKKFKYINCIYIFQTKQARRNQIASVNFVCHWKTTKLADFVCDFGLPCRAYRP
jgi:hypothetical protein